MILPVMLSGAAPSGGEDLYGELAAEDLGRLEREATRWILDLEERNRPRARPLTETEKAALGGHFSAELLERARLREVAGIDNPHFYTAFFSERGKPLPIDFREAAGLALVDTVLVVSSRVAPSSPGWLPLVFHELVHLAQVEALGREHHVADYVRGWAANGFEYRSIPQEAQAFDLAARFRAAPERPFSVAAEVARRFGREGVPAEVGADRGRRP